MDIKSTLTYLYLLTPFSALQAIHVLGVKILLEVLKISIELKFRRNMYIPFGIKTYLELWCTSCSTSGVGSEILEYGSVYTITYICAFKQHNVVLNLILLPAETKA